MFRTLVTIASSVGLLLFSRCASTQERPKVSATNAPQKAGTSAFYDFKMKTLDGKDFDFATLKGKKVLLVNTASKCGLTPQYEDLEKLHEAYKGKNVVVLGFPANNFMGQEPGSNADIQSFCTKNYGVTFQMFEKLDVTGEKKHPLYQWLTDKSKNGWNEQEPNWNFSKYLVNEQGELVSFFPSKTLPMSKEITEKL